MKSEFEIKILDINELEMEAKILGQGGEKIDSTLQKIKVFKLPQWEQTKFIRIRESSNSPVELTYKNVTGDEIGDIKELELIVDNFENASRFLSVCGFKQKQFLEKKRVLYNLDKCELVIDTIPRYLPYVEIEGPSKDDVIDCALKLGHAYSVEQHEKTSAEMKKRLKELEKYSVYTFEKQE